MAGIRRIDAGQYLDQGRFARAVLTKQRQDTAAVDVERNIRKRASGPKKFGNIGDPDLGHCVAIQSVAAGTHGPSTSPPAKLAVKWSRPSIASCATLPPAALS